MSSKPFVYILKHVHSSRHYIGVRYAKNCQPDDLMTEKGYQTSSKLVHELIDKDGLKSFIIKRIRFFDSTDSAVDYEYKLLQRVKAKTNTKIININDKRAFAMNEEAYELIGLKAVRRHLVKSFGTYDFDEIREKLLPFIAQLYTIKELCKEFKYGNRTILKSILPELTDKEYLRLAKIRAIDNPETKRKLSEASKRATHTEESFRKQAETRKKNGTRNKNLGVKRNAAAAKDASTGEKLGLISHDDPRWKTGQIISSNKDIPQHAKNKKKMVNSEGNIVLVEKDYSSDELSKWKPSDEHYEKICKAAKLGGQVQSTRKWYTNGVDNIFIDGDPPSGYKKGRVLPRRVCGQ